MDGREEMPALYRHTQQGYFMGLGLAFVALTQVGSLVRAMRAHKPRAWLRLPGIVVTTGLAYGLSALTVEITREHLSMSFRRGLFRRRIDLHDIQSVEQVVLPWYYGWGLRLTPKGWLYNVQGRDAVRLGLSSGSRLTIGTDEPERLRAAIEAVQSGC